MALGLRFRSETVLISSGNTNYAAGTKVLVAAAGVAPTQRVGVYSCVINAIAASTVQFQDTSGGALSAIFSLPVNGFLSLDTQINGDPRWMAGAGLGVQLVVGGTGPVAADVWIGYGN